jgi:hypothetical protein
MTVVRTPHEIAVARVHRNEEAHGFCLVCGSVWPCWRAVRPSTQPG